MTRPIAARRARIGAAVLTGCVALTAIWSTRTRWAGPLALDILRVRGVPVRATVDAVGPGGLIVRNLVVGDPTRPDLTAVRAEFVVRWVWISPRLVSARLVHPVLRLTIGRDGRVALGTLDKLRSPPDGNPTRLPDLDVWLSDARLLVATPYGPLSAAASGGGNPARRFAGVLALDRARLDVGGCVVPVAGGRLALGARDRVGTISGMIGLGALACRGWRAHAVALRTAMTLADPITGARGRIEADLAGPGGIAANAETARAVFTGGIVSGRIEGGVAFKAIGGRYGAWSAARATYRAPLTYAPFSAELRSEGPIHLANVALSAAARARLLLPTGGLSPTPLGPLEAAARAALARAARDFDVVGKVDYGVRPNIPLLNDAVVVARSGARLMLHNSIDDAHIEVGGGGLPKVRIDLSAPSRGSVRLPEWRAGSARIGATTLAFAWPGGTAPVAVTGPLLLDGPLGAGRVEGLAIPAAALRISTAPLTVTPVRCLDVWARRVMQPRYALRDVAFGICPGRTPAFAASANASVRGAFSIIDLVTRGTLAGTGFTASSGPVAVTLGGTVDAPIVQLRARPVHVAAALPGGARMIDIAALHATARETGAGWGFAGRIEDAALPGAPLVLGPVSGPWTMGPSGALAFGPADVRVADPLDVRPRVQPLNLTRVTLGYADGIARAAGGVALASTGAPLARFEGVYHQASGTGSLDARADVAFAPALQPYQISERARGVIENVAGHVAAGAQLAYVDGRVSGAASVTLDRLSFATAALGPVSAVSGTLRLPNLPAVTSAPGQRFTIGGVNPGFAVADGVSRLQLLSPTRLRIEELIFPFVGGQLSLAPVTIDTAIPDRRFTLGATGLDLARFVERLNLHDLDATGTFDGVLPVVLTNAGGRIEHGRLVARPPGGRLRYVGPIGADLPAGARLAFGALRAMRYDTLTVGVDGDLGGDLVSSIAFTGANEAPLATGKSLPKLGPGVPFRFGVIIRAPFRALLGTAASLEDATPFITGARASPPPTR